LPYLAGDYPDVMKDLAGDRLPRFTDEEKKLLKANRPDFFGLNHYTTQLVAKPAMTSGGTVVDLYTAPCDSFESVCGT
jgi:beta-glucosidase/6-phospho-beta-glucosidase/beta-galactosidase